MSSAGGFDGAADCWPLVAAEVVHDDHIARLQLRHEHLIDICLEGIAVDRAVEDHRGRNPVEAEAGHEGGRLPMPVRNAGPEPLAFASPSA